MHLINSWLKAISGVMLIIVCAMLPSAFLLPQQDLSSSVIPLHSNWQIQGLLLTALLCGPEIGTICAIAYLIIGLFFLPVFHGGGSVGYIITNEFGYLLGFIPSAWLCGILSKKNSNPNLINYSFYTIFSLCILHFTGIIYLSLVKIFGNSIDNLFELILINTFKPFPTQLVLCISISLISIILKRLFILK